MGVLRREVIEVVLTPKVDSDLHIVIPVCPSQMVMPVIVSLEVVERRRAVSVKRGKTDGRQCPGPRSITRKYPLPLVSALLASWVASFVTVTCALGTREPDASKTVPSIPLVY